MLRYAAKQQHEDVETPNPHFRFLVCAHPPAAKLPLAETDLVPEWPLQAMSHVPTDIIKAVMKALIEINETHPAAVAGGYSTWDPPLSYTALR